MRHTSTLGLVAGLVSVASAKKCQNITVSVNISARNGKFDQTALTPVTNIDVTNFITTLTRQGTNYTEDVLQGYETVSGTYDLATTYCEPDCGAPDVVQLLTHGIGFDRSYWDVPYNAYNYSYVNEAVDEYGYATFSWDRLGIGMSAHGEPVNEIQAFLEVEALKALTDDLRAGSIEGVPKFSKVLHVGHSFGSEHTYLLTAKYPDSSDGIALTGFSQNGSFVPFFELGANFVQANGVAALSAYPDGYLADGDASAVQTNFFSPGSFDAGILNFAFTTGEPVTVGELLTIGGETAVPNTFKGPVFIITGERDNPYCGQACENAPTGYPNIPSTSQQNFPNTQIEVFIVPGAGHGLNLEYSHPITYAKINDFFVQNGNAPNATCASSTRSSSSSAAAVTASGTAKSGAASASATGTAKSATTVPASYSSSGPWDRPGHYGAPAYRGGQ